MATRQRVLEQTGFVLHSQPWRETSLIVEIFSRDYGRLPLVAKGARRPLSVLRSVLTSFQPLSFSWSGGGEVKTLTMAQWQGGMRLLCGPSLLSGFYLNELLLRLLAREDPHPELFDLYYACLAQMSAEGANVALALRRFERGLLVRLGYLPDLSRVAEDGSPLDEQRHYAVLREYGVSKTTNSTNQFSGKVLLAIANDDFSDNSVMAPAKMLLRTLINEQMNGQSIQTRKLFTEI